MTVNDAYANSNEQLADATDWVIDGSDSETGAVNITEMGGGSDANIFREHDTTGDGTFNIRVQIDTTSGTWHSQGNDLLVAGSQNVRLVIRNVSGTAADFYVTGYEVDN